MRRVRRTIGIVAAVGLTGIVSAGSRIWAEDMRCPSYSVGESVDQLTGSRMSIGTSVSGIASGGGVVMYAGVWSCAPSSAACLKGDVDHNGVIDGRDVDGYARVRISGVGSAWELCAADVEVGAFVGLLLSQ